MTEKVKVSREVAEAIQYLLNHKSYKYTKKELLVNHASMRKHPKRYWTEETRILYDIDLFEMAEILVKGYEIEKTPHEKVHDIYREAYQKYHGIKDIRFHAGVAHGVRQTLKALNEEIEGIYTIEESQEECKPSVT